ncbi:MAG: hybrid sensor histidine kinase/response regulator, partial [Lachnospiraceae bacterium]|nr:hybrid sensor histidine kinase/response regulator [Lachnospiraceae bacterium]
MKKTHPFDRFTHDFLESGRPKADLAAKADVIFFHLKEAQDGEALQALILAKRSETELILLLEQDKIEEIEEFLPAVSDIWPMPMSDTEAGFRIQRWMERCRREKDSWQTSHFLDAMINNTPNLIWYKDKDGVHEKVNDSFCKTVNK